MARVARRVGDRRVLRLIRRYLDAGVMVGGVKVATAEGTPQGSPLSPLLANSMLDDLDAELERRGHTFVRYADDLRVYVASERAATRVLEGVTAFVEERLLLRVNQAKSGVAPTTVRGLLGFGFVRNAGQVRIRLDPRTKHRLKARLRQLTDRHRSIAMAVRLTLLSRFLGGWTAYFALAETPRCSTRSTSGSAGGCARSAGRSGRGSPLAGACQAPLRSAGPCRTGTGPPSALFRSAPVSAASGNTGEPPDADPHVRWCGRGRCDAVPYPIPGGGNSGNGSSGWATRARSAPDRDPIPVAHQRHRAVIFGPHSRDRGRRAALHLEVREKDA
jgi:hypothetical protein